MPAAREPQTGQCGVRPAPMKVRWRATRDCAPPLPSLEWSVWNRVEARAARARDAGIPAPHKTIPRRRSLVGARIERDHFPRRFRLETIARFSHWPSFGRMPNHFSASCSVVSSR